MADDTSSVESLNPESFDSESSLESVQLQQNSHFGSPDIDMIMTFPGEVDYLDHQIKTELSLTKDELKRYQTRFSDALTSISILLWNADYHNPSKPEFPQRDDNITYFKQCVEKFMTRISEDTSDGEGLAEANDSAWKQTEQLSDIFTNQLKDYIPNPTPTNGRRDLHVTDEHVEFPTPEPKGEACPSTVPKKVNESTGQDMWTVPRKTKDTDLKRSVADHESNAEQDQKRIMFGVPSAATKTNKGAFNTAIHMPGKNGRDFLAMINNEQLSGDEVIEMEVTVPSTAHEENEEINVKLDSMSTQLEELKMMLSNVTKMPYPSPVVSNMKTDTFNNALYMPGTAGTNFLIMLSDGQAGDDNQFARHQEKEKSAGNDFSGQETGEITVHNTAHVEKEEISVKLDFMHAEIEEVMMMLSNMLKPPTLSIVQPLS